MNKGFTLIELIGVVVIIAIMALIIIPPVQKSIKQGKETADEKSEESVEIAARNWASDNKSALPKIGEYFLLKIEDLKNGGYINQNENATLESSCVKIANNNNNYTYEFESKSDCIIPTVSATVSDTITNNKRDVTITGSTGTAYYSISKTDGAGSDGWKLLNSDSKATIAEGQGTWYIYVKTKAGNVSKGIKVIINVDLQPPVCTWSGPTGTMQNGYIKKDQSLTYTLSCTDNSGSVNKTTLTTSNITSSNTNVATVTSVSDPAVISSGYKYTVVTTAGSSTGTATLTLTAGLIADTVGNKNLASSSSVLPIDNEGPTISNVSNSSNNNWTTSVTIKGTISDSKSGVAKTVYIYSDGADHTDWNSGSTSTSVVGTWTASRNQEVWIKAYDNLGNTSTVSAGWIRIENFYLTGSVDCCKGYYINGSWLDRLFHFYPNGATSGVNYSTVSVGYTGCSTIAYGSGTSSCGTATWTANEWIFGRANGPVCAYANTNAGNHAELCES